MIHVEGVLTAALSRQPSDRVVQRLTSLTRLTSSATIVEAEAVLVLANRGGSGGDMPMRGRKNWKRGDGSIVEMNIHRTVELGELVGFMKNQSS